MTRTPLHVRKKIARAYAEARRHQALQPLTDSQVLDISTIAWVTLRAITESGEATESAWAVLAQASNMALLLAEKEIGDEWLPQIKSAQDALMRAAHRGKRTGRWGLDGDGIRAIETALEVHDQQIALATRAEILSALATLRARIDKGHVLETEAIN